MEEEHSRMKVEVAGVVRRKKNNRVSIVSMFFIIEALNDDKSRHAELLEKKIKVLILTYHVHLH